MASARIFSSMRSWDRITAGAHTITVTCTDSMRRHFTHE